ncbi:3-phosphoshikimate 1- carboxyvinyltransferase [Natrinema pallidum DSM 3751]|uniref:UDP-N-acetylglucosamine 1-carboxyvinyltransferase n=1 Tax=Natrinema pallidum DSM 3751 TaxID=1227495 RepID=L9Z3C6_9EURY|nr:UDP-N-acetylglucosamine 1-carboxyvinyltransferase [Natrinema pallidum]ELY79678.1 3-phosphoshikimate 1- carboxyvinyltransferase [Natrinema pallidum DSM 3751]
MKYTIEPSILNGEVDVSGAKNSYLRLLAASLLTDSKLTLHNSPTSILDGKIHLQMLEELGKDTQIVDSDTVVVDEAAGIKSELIWEERSIRNTLLILGALTTRTGKGSVPLPGGCSIGEGRPYDLHVYLLEQLGAEVRETDTQLIAEAPDGLVGNDIHLRIRSTGATENSILCGTLAEGKTTVWNPHIRPEIMDLISMLRKMGAKIKVFGQERIEIEGVESLDGCEHTVLPDNLEALTWLVGSAITNGDVQINNFPFDSLQVPLIFLRESGAKVFRNGDSAIVRNSTPYPLELSTGPYPSVNSDMQPILSVYGSMGDGTSKIVDLRFPGRYEYAEELGKMGLDYEVEDNVLVVDGHETGYSGTDVTATDLRAGAALSLAACVADGRTTITNAEEIERGYDNFVEKFSSLDGGISVQED